jgi:hypothetical protein
MIGDRRVEAERAAAHQIAARCGGLPQAIRIAGTKLRLQPHLSLAQLAGRLADERELLDALEIGGLSLRRCAQAYEDELSARDRADLRSLRRMPGPEFSLGDLTAVLGRRGRQAEQVLDVMLEVYAVEATGKGRFEMPRWLRAYLADLDREEEPTIGSASGSRSRASSSRQAVSTPSAPLALSAPRPWVTAGIPSAVKISDERLRYLEERVTVPADAGDLGGLLAACQRLRMPFRLLEQRHPHHGRPGSRPAGTSARDRDPPKLDRRAPWASFRPRARTF